MVSKSSPGFLPRALNVAGFGKGLFGGGTLSDDARDGPAPAIVEDLRSRSDVSRDRPAFRGSLHLYPGNLPDAILWPSVHRVSLPGGGVYAPPKGAQQIDGAGVPIYARRRGGDFDEDNGTAESRRVMRLSAYLDLAVEELLRSDLSYLTQPTDYDTSWAARLKNADGTLAYPDLLQGLVERQHPDGSWGGRVPYGYDRMLTTLAVVMLLARIGHRRHDEEARSAGERYVWQQASKFGQEGEPTVGFEMLLPMLLQEGEGLGLNLPYAQLRRYEEERAKKLTLLPKSQIFKKRTTALFSLEAFAGGVDLDAVSRLLSEDGTIAGSPSATAWFLNQFPDWRERHPRSTAYLEDLLSRYETGLPTIAPYDVLARAWVLHYLHHGGLLAGHEELLKPHHDHLRRSWRPEGLGWSSTAFPDADDTAMTLLALHRAGYEVDGRLLLAYEREDHFAVFEHEMDPSISANLHILEALETLPKGDRKRTREKILRYVLAARHYDSFWSDKWHASVYYPTSQALMSLAGYAPDEMENTLRWLHFTQRIDGSWGQFESTVEETAMVLLSLLIYHRDVRPLPREPLRRAAGYLIDNEAPFKRDYPELWIAKVLYAPTFVVRAIILGALKLYETTVGDRV